MSEKLKNPSAFPVNDETWNDVERSGMTLLDYFAAKAMQGLCAHNGSTNNIGAPHTIAGRSYEIAAAMLKEREAHL